jgi:urease accessory protein
VDYWIFVIDCAAGDDIPRKRGLGMLQADLLVVNKIDLAPHVGADLNRIRRDVQVNRPQRQTLYTNLRSPQGAAEVFAAIQRDALFACADN